MKVEVYSDMVCPWCYIGERRFARARAAFPGGDDIEVVFRSFQLDPEAPTTAVPNSQYLERRFGGPVGDKLAPVRQAAAGEGITIDWDRALAVNTHTAHRLLRLAEREYGVDVQRALMDRLFDAHFTRGGDVADHALLTELARAVGMDEARARAYLDSGEGAAELDAELDEARRRGVRAVPTFVFDDQYVVSGAQPASTFLQVLEEVQRRALAAQLAGGSAEDDDGRADGVCATGGEAP